MPSDSSVSEWIAGLRDHEEAAAQALYERYIQRLTSLARKKLGGMPRRASDEDDIAQIVLNSFFTGAANARFPALNDRNDLWQVLVMLTERKVVDQIRRQFSEKRKGEVGESALMFRADGRSGISGMNELMACEPSPEFAAECAEELALRLQQLDSDELRRIAVWKLEGRTNDEIARQFACVTRTIERRLELIRRCWQE